MESQFQRVLVAVKPDHEGLPLSAHHARLVAQELGAELRLTSCVYEAQVAARLAGKDSAAFGAKAGLMDAERRRLQALAGSLAEWGVATETAVRWGYPARDVILSEARDWGADILVVGVHGSEHEPLLRLRDLDWRLMAESPCPLLVVKDFNFSGYPRILAGIDPLHRHAEPSGLDDAVLRIASGLAARFHAELTVVHAYPPPDTFELASAVEVEPGVLYGSENVEDVHKGAVTRLMQTHGIEPERACVQPGRPEEVILAQARSSKARLLVIGAVKRGWLEHALLGSTAEKLLAEVPCDVLLVNGSGSREE